MTDLSPGRRPAESYEHYVKRRRVATARVREYLHPVRGGRNVWCSRQLMPTGMGVQPYTGLVRGTYRRDKHGELGDR